MNNDHQNQAEEPNSDSCDSSAPHHCSCPSELADLTRRVEHLEDKLLPKATTQELTCCQCQNTTTLTTLPGETPKLPSGWKAHCCGCGTRSYYYCPSCELHPLTKHPIENCCNSGYLPWF